MKAIITEIHPGDAHYVIRKKLIGKIIEVDKNHVHETKTNYLLPKHSVGATGRINGIWYSFAAISLKPIDQSKFILKTLQDEFYDCCKSIIKAVETTNTKALGYAYGYATAGLRMQTEDEIICQARYLLSNITHWRGEQARKVRTSLKHIVA